MRILVTGGTGFLGKRLVEILQKEHEVIALSKEGVKVPGAETITGDILDAASLKKAFERKPDIVYHLAAILDEHDPVLWKANVEGTRNVCDAAIAVGIKRMIFTSSAGVLGSGFLKEDAPYNPETGYEKSKAEAEKILVQKCTSSRTPYTILRFPIVYGPNGYWFQILRAAEQGYPLIGKAENRWHLLHINDAIDALLLALNPRAENRIYNIASGDVHTYRETYAIIARALGLGMTKKGIPVWKAKMLARIYEGYCKLVGKKPKVTKMVASIERLVRDREVDISRARSELGYSPRYDLVKGMQELAQEYSKK